MTPLPTPLKKLCGSRRIGKLVKVVLGERFALFTPFRGGATDRTSPVPDASALVAHVNKLRVNGHLQHRFCRQLARIQPHRTKKYVVSRSSRSEVKRNLRLDCPKCGPPIVSKFFRFFQCVQFFNKSFFSSNLSTGTLVFSSNNSNQFSSVGQVNEKR